MSSQPKRNLTMNSSSASASSLIRGGGGGGGGGGYLRHRHHQRQSEIRIDIKDTVLTSPELRRDESVMLRNALWMSSSSSSSSLSISSLSFPILVVVEGPSGCGKAMLIDHVFQQLDNNNSNSNNSETPSTVTPVTPTPRRIIKIPLKTISRSTFDVARSLLLDVLDITASTARTGFYSNDDEELQKILMKLDNYNNINSNNNDNNDNNTENSRSQSATNNDDPYIWTQMKNVLRNLIRNNNNNNNTQNAQPIIFFIQDIQNTDERILEMVHFLLVDEELVDKFACCVSKTTTCTVVVTIDAEGEEKNVDHLDEVWIQEINSLRKTKVSSSSSSSSIRRIQLDLLTVRQVELLVAKVMRRDVDDEADYQQVIVPLAHLLHERTHGNLFCVQQIFDLWHDQSSIRYNYNSNKWDVTSPIDDLRRDTALSSNVASVLCSRIETNLSREGQFVVQVASLFHNSETIHKADLQVIVTNHKWIFGDDVQVWGDDNLMNGEDDWLQRGLDEACSQTMMIMVTEDEFQFTHEKIQAAAHQLILQSLTFPCDDSAATKSIHARIGKLLLDALIDDHTKDDSLPSNPDLFLHVKNNPRLFTCADQFAYGLDQLDEIENPQRLLQLFLLCGKVAANNMSFEAASDYLGKGLQLMTKTDGFKTDKKSFQACHGIVTDLYVLYADMEVKCGRTKEGLDAANVVLRHANNKEDKIRAMEILVRCYQTDYDFDNLLSVTIDLLNELGERTFPKKPRRRYLDREIKKTLSLLHSRKTSVEANLGDLPQMSSEKKRVMSILHDLLAPSMISTPRHPFFVIASSRMTRMTLKYGLCDLTGSALSTFALCLLGYRFFQSVKESLELAELSVKVIDSMPASANIGTCLSFCGIVLTTEPSRQFLGTMKKGYGLSLEGGDTASAFFALAFHNIMYFYDGAPLRPLLEDVENLSPQMLDFNQEPCFLLNLPTWQCLMALTGVTSENKGCLEKFVKGGNFNADHLLNFEMQVAFYKGDIQKALEIKNQIDDEPSKIIAKHCPFFQARSFFYCLICIEMFRRTKERRYLVEARQLSNTIKKMVQTGFIKMLNKYQLIDAELQSISITQNKNKRMKKRWLLQQSSTSTTMLDDDDDDRRRIIRLYNTAISNSARCGFLQDSALANYLCGMFCLRCCCEGDVGGTTGGDSAVEAQIYLQKASDVFRDWGGDEIALSIEKRHPSFFPDRINGPESAIHKMES